MNDQTEMTLARALLVGIRNGLLLSLLVVAGAVSAGFALADDVQCVQYAAQVAP